MAFAQRIFFSKIITGVVFLSFLFLSCSVERGETRDTICDLYVIDSPNKSIGELGFTNKLTQSLKEKLNILSNRKKNRQSNSCELIFRYSILSYNSNISLVGDVSNINEKVIVSIELKDSDKNLIFKDKVIEFFSIQISNLKYIGITNRNKIYDTKVESIANKILLSIKRNI